MVIMTHRRRLGKNGRPGDGVRAGPLTGVDVIRAYGLDMNNG